MENLRYRGLRLSSAILRWIKTRFTRVGWLALCALAASAVLGVDTDQNAAYQVFTFLLALLALSMLSGLTFRARFEVRRVLPRFGTVGEVLPYLLAVRNLSEKAQSGLMVSEDVGDSRPSFEEFLRLREHSVDHPNLLDRVSGYNRWRRLIDRRQAGVPYDRGLPDLPPLEECEIPVRIIPSRRGRLRLRGITIARPDLLGLSKACYREPTEQSVLILPKRYPMPRISLPGRRMYQHGGVALSSSVGESQEFVSLRDYRPGDPLRCIHWKSWPKMGKLIVKEYQEEYFVRHALVLDTFSSAEHSELFEEAVSVAASFACSVLTQESLLDLLFVGAEAYCFTAGRGLAGVDRMLEILACAQTCLDKPFEELQHSVVRRHSSLSGCICVLLAWDDKRRRFIRHLRSLGVPTLVIVMVDPSAPEKPSTVSELEEKEFHRLELGKIAEGLARITA